jgi:hypothetical protein
MIDRAGLTEGASAATMAGFIQTSSTRLNGSPIVIKNRAKSNPGLSNKGQDRLEDRLSRRAEALRANLQKRKEQMRARADTDKKSDDTDEKA